MWRLAWRNLWRNRTRTLILLTAIAFSHGLMLVWLGLAGDMYGQMRRGAVESAGGAVLIHGEGFWQARATEIAIDDPTAVRRAAQTVDAVEETIPRVLIDGLLSSPRGHAPGRLTGVDPEKQAALRDLREYVVRGRFPSDEGDRPIALGAGAAESLGVELGDKVVLTTSDLEGDLKRALFRLRGVLETGSAETDDALAVTTLGAAQRAIGMGDRVHQIGLLAETGADTTAIAGRVRGRLGERADALEILPWQRAMPEMVGFIELDSAMLYVYLVVIFLIVVFVVANTFMMAVKERVREFGLLNALGLRDGRIGTLVLTETVLLAAVALASGLVIGSIGHLAIAAYGIDLAVFGADEMQLSGVALSETVIRSRLEPFEWLAASAGVFAAILVSAAYPVWRATKLAPSKAMEFYEH